MLGSVRKLKRKRLLGEKGGFPKANKNMNGKLIDIDPKKLWIYRCKESQKCSICPFSLAETKKDNSNQIDKQSEIGKHLLEGILEGQTKYDEMETLLFHCSKCNQKWAIAGEIPISMRFAFEVNKGESYEGSKLDCFTC
jgi:hypothetical protein